MFEKIVINSLKGIERIIAQKCDKDGDGVIQNDFRYQEVSIFNKAKQTYDGESFIVEGTAYHKDGRFSGIRNVNPLKSPAQNKIQTSQTVNSPEQVAHKKRVKCIADSWAKTYGISNQDGKFTEFVEKVYRVAKEINLSIPNEKVDSKYPTVEDQVVDELMGAFANESKFRANARSKNGLYHGVFQFSQTMMNELTQKHRNVENVSMTTFEKLDIIKQLDYMLEGVKVCKKYYSKLGNAAISAKQVYAMWKFPAAGNLDAVIEYKDKYGIKRKYKGAEIQQEKCDTIKAKQRERGKLSFG